ncbi:MAG: hypothetical protein IKF36_03320 [Bacilli bacterium]|nr:hypothetical protein [Bacilli bacterium]
MAKKNRIKKPVDLFDKRADILAGDNDQYHIRKNRVYICGSDYYGKVYTITSNRYNRENVHIIKEFYPYDNKRMRFLIVNFKNAKKFKTREKLPDGTERKINVIEKFTDVSEYICSIGNIKKITSDLLPEEELSQKPVQKVRKNIKKLILKPEEIKSKIKDKNKRRVG